MLNKKLFFTKIFFEKKGNFMKGKKMDSMIKNIDDVKKEAAKTLLTLKKGKKKYNDDSITLFKNNLITYRRNTDYNIKRYENLIDNGYEWYYFIKKHISIYDRDNIVLCNNYLNYINTVRNKNILLKYFYEKVILLSFKLIEANINCKEYSEINIIYQKFVFYVSKVIKHTMDIGYYIRERFVNPKTIYDKIIKK